MQFVLFAAVWIIRIIILFKLVTFVSTENSINDIIRSYICTQTISVASAHNICKHISFLVFLLSGKIKLCLQKNFILDYKYVFLFYDIENVFVLEF